MTDGAVQMTLLGSSGADDWPLDALWEDGERIFCRTWRVDERGDRREIMAVRSAVRAPASATNARFTHEYELKDHLDSAWAMRPLELLKACGQTVLLLEKPDSGPLDRLAVPTKDLGQFLRLAVSLSDALGRLHERGLIHKDIKPSNIIVNTVVDRIWLTGFGIASRFPREKQSPDPPELIAGTLAYMAPEQTGRTNRSTDSRSDLYSAGITLYQMLTGALPFTASDPMEWIHCHIARQPAPPIDRVRGVPPLLSAIIMKLLAKAAEDRYQTAGGLQRDLQRCLADWERMQWVDPFPLGQYDIPAKLLIPEKLYGREREIETLLAAFEEVVSKGGVGQVLVSGYSGIGKSSVVNELHKVLVPPRGLFAAGKFDQYKRGIPYATLAQAFQGLVSGILIKSEAELARWRELFLEALGPNGQLIVNLIPELALIIGEQPPPPDLPPQDAQKRFQHVLGRFLAVFARPEHPLALFFDDLQWLDTATLDLLVQISTDPDMRHLMLVGAYRDNEVTASHPLMRIVESLRRSGRDFREIVLTPLEPHDVRRLVADCCHADYKDVQPLAELVFEKTRGNPFFVIQFVLALEEQGLLAFDPRISAWDWDLARIKGQGFTDNVVDLMAVKLDRLPANTQETMRLFACLGNATDITTLALVCGKPEEALHSALEDAVRAGLILRFDTSYAFVHDRVQEAAYDLINHQQRPSVHLDVGRALVSHLSRGEIDERIFEIVDHFNRGASLIVLAKEREQTAELNLLAGRRAKQATAYSSALIYLATGRELLADDNWDRQYRLLFDLELHRSECEYLTNELVVPERRLAALAARAATLIDRAAVTRQRMALYVILDRIDRAVEVGLDFLAHVGIKLPLHPTNAEVQQEFDKIRQRLGERSIEELFDLPPTADPNWRATIDVMAVLDSPALFFDNSLGCLIVGRIINLSLEHGHADGSCFAYVYSNLAFGCRFGDYRSGFRFAQLGFDLMEKRGLSRFKPRIYLGFAMATSWIKHLSTSQALLRRAVGIAQDSGDLVFLGYALRTLTTNLLASGTPLAEAQREAESALDFATKARFGVIFDVVSTQLGLIRTLRGHTSAFGSFDGEFDEIRFEQHLQDPRHEFAACWYWVRKLQARYYAGDYASAVEAEKRAYELLAKSTSFRLYFEAADYHFFAALTRAACFRSGSSQDRSLHRDMLLTHYKQLEAWAEFGPENFASRVALVGAEIASLDGRELDAERLYEDAVRSARQQGFVQNEGLANELAAQFHAERGFDTFAKAYLRNSRTCYHSWGAHGKVSQLERLHSHLRSEAVLSSEATIGEPIQFQDMATVIKVSQALSGEIGQRKLIDTIMLVALEHAGAERGVLLLSLNMELRQEAEAIISRDGIVIRRGVEGATAIPDYVINYVTRTKDVVILEDASAHPTFSADSYIRERNARSVLCLPLMNETKLTGILYLENNLTTHVFTPNRIAVLKLLALQAAISLENSRLYSDLAEREELARESAQRYHDVQMQLAHVNRMTALGQLSASIAHEINQPLSGIHTNANTCLRMLAADPPNVSGAQETARRSIRDAKRAADIISRLRALFAKKQVRIDPVDLNDASREVISLATRDLESNQVILRSEFAGDVPLIHGDRVQLQQVILNLMRNASDAMRDINVRQRELVITTAKAEPNGVFFSIQDSGPGIDPAKLDRIFDAFYTTKPDGLGMGLSVCRTIVEAHGGKLWATAADPHGAIFQFTLPGRG
jgi:predicted ATPase/signal transduction histidine kinase